MRTVKMLALTAAVALGVSGVALGQASKPVPKPMDKPAKAAEAAAGAKKGGLMGEYAIMARELNLSEAQKTKLEEVVNANVAAMKDWDAKNGAREEDLRKQHAELSKTGDKAKTAEVSAKLKELTTAKNELRTRASANVDAVLTPEQRQQWEGFELYRGVLKGMSKITLTDAQLADIKARSQAAAAPMVKATDDKAKDQVRSSLRESVIKQVLTEEQRKTLGVTEPKGKPAAAHSDKPARKADKPR